jgi:predicted nucleotidyltransferase
MTTEMVSDELIQRVVEYAPQQVILFGSYAYGTPDRDSDIDLLIIKDTDEPFIERVVQVCKATRGMYKGIPFDPIVLTPEELDGRLRKGDHFFQDIVKKGRVMYAR